MSLRSLKPLSGNRRSYIRDLRTNDFLEFDFFSGDGSVSDSVSPQWESIPIIGRSVPLKSYSSTGPRTIGLNLAFVSSAFQYDSSSDAEKVVYNRVNFLRSLAYPSYDGDFATPPSYCLVVVGQFIKVKAVMTSCDVTWKTLMSLTGYPLYADVNVSFETVMDNPFSRDTIRSGGDKTVIESRFGA